MPAHCRREHRLRLATRTGNRTAVNDDRQADPVVSGGYFSNDPLGLWTHAVASWTATVHTAAGCVTLLERGTNKTGQLPGVRGDRAGELVRLGTETVTGEHQVTESVSMEQIERRLPLLIATDLIRAVLLLAPYAVGGLVVAAPALLA